MNSEERDVQGKTSLHYSHPFNESIGKKPGVTSSERNMYKVADEFIKGQLTNTLKVNIPKNTYTEEDEESISYDENSSDYSERPYKTDRVTSPYRDSLEPHYESPT